MKVKVGFMYHDGRKIAPYDRTFNAHMIRAFHSANHWNFGVRMLILIKRDL